AGLPKRVQAALPSGREGELLARVATSKGYGAPPAHAGRAGGSSASGEGHEAGRSGRVAGAHPEGDATAVSAVTGALSDSGVAILGAAMIVLSGGALLARRTRRRDS
ncbi:MAG TPA: hypothetical protein VF545_01085, partial [Thermoleophilaceae bacterium]